MVTLKQVEALYWVGVLGSFSAAAQKLNIAQSTISKRIQELEDVLQTTLFDRDKRSGRLTMKGAEVLGLAEEMLRLQKRLREAVGSHQTYAGTFRVGITELIAMTWLPKLISLVKAAYPKLTLEPHVDTLSNLMAKLREGHVDLVIGPRAPAEDRIASLPLSPVEQCWMCSPELYEGRTALPLKRIAEFPLLMQTGGSGLHAMITRFLTDNGVATKSVISCNGMVALAKLAESGFGVTCLPRLYFMSEVESGKLQILKTTPALPALEYAACYRQDSMDNLSASIAALAASACDFGDPRLDVPAGSRKERPRGRAAAARAAGAHSPRSDRP